MRTLAVVPARSGSKGIPGKNTRDFCGKPLALWAIECGQRTCDRVCVTTDDADLYMAAEDMGAEMIDRPSDLAQDDTPMLDVLRHVLAMQGRGKTPDAVVLLQPTSPLRTDEHVLRALDSLDRHRNADSVVSVVEIPAHASPDYAVTLSSGLLRIPPATRRQDCRRAFYRDGTVYAIRAELLARGALYGRALPLVIPPDQSVTIDTAEDWARAERMWRKRNV